jgi:hypothetical protein
MTVSKRVKQYGREDILPKRVKVETMNEIRDRRIAGSPQKDTGTGGGAGRERAWIIALRVRFWT